MPCIHGWQSSLVLKNIPCLSETIPSPSPYITFIFPFWLHPQRSCRPIAVSTFSGLRCPFDLHMYVHSYSGDWRTLSHVPWFIILKLLVHGLYTFQILISLEWRRFNLGKESLSQASLHGRRWAYYFVIETIFDCNAEMTYFQRSSYKGTKFLDTWRLVVLWS